MPVWSPLSVEVESELTLRSWQVMQLPCGDFHLVRYCIENREGRTSSAVEFFDKERLVAMTDSGRVYRLLGAPGGNMDAEYVWRRWARINDANEWTDIGPAIWREVQSACAAKAPTSAARAAGAAS